MRPRVLFVDDERLVTVALERDLRREPFDVLTARSGHEALELLRRERIDAVVADEKMPGMTGSELLTIIGRDYPRVIRMMLTGNISMDTDVRELNGGGVAHLFTKPYNDLELAATIRALLDQRNPAPLS